MILTGASAIYGAAATWRRQWYASGARRRRLERPVISVGNLSVGGSGKTPVVACLARLLLDLEERPAILMRGYAREVSSAGVTVVADGSRILADVRTAGDEALMLARALPGIAVLVGPDRHASGRVAETDLDVTLHLLDDGFQHLRLARTVDLLAVSEEDLDDRVLPAGRLREPLASARAADAVLNGGSESAAERLRTALGVTTVFQTCHSQGTPRLLEGAVFGRADLEGRLNGRPVFAVAGIARPRRFFDDLAADGWRVAGSMVFRDHHRFSERDMARIADAARGAGAELVLTTEKDAVRLEGLRRDGPPIAAVPLHVTLEPAFLPWLVARIAAARSSAGRVARVT